MAKMDKIPAHICRRDGHLCIEHASFDLRAQHKYDSPSLTLTKLTQPPEFRIKDHSYRPAVKVLSENTSRQRCFMDQDSGYIDLKGNDT